MAKLIDLFHSREEEIYTKFKQKSSGEDQPYVVTPLNDTEDMNPAYEDQFNPVSLSAQRDLKRMTNFSTSTKGLVFLAKQQLLQSGNTFANTRLYNPTNVVLHAVPFVHLPRHINLRNDVIKSILEFVGVGFGSPLPSTTLQKETRDRLELKNATSQAWLNLNSKGGMLTNIEKTTNPFGPSIGQVRLPFADRRSLGRKIIDQIISPVTRTISGVQAQLGLQGNYGRPEVNEKNRLSIYYSTLTRAYNQHTDDEVSVAPGPFTATGSVLTDGQISYAQAFGQWKKQTKNDKGKTKKRISIGVDGTRSPTDGRKFLAQTRYYKDLTQLPENLPGNLPFIADESFSDPLDSDAVDVLFRIRNGNRGPVERVRFRAFLEGLTENITPSYIENKYVGRYETYYIYNNVLRDVSFNLSIHAFSEEELDRVFQKMTYLSSLAYPANNNNYLTPLLFEFTIGRLYINQPALLMNLSHTIDEQTSWDIDNQLPMTVNSSLSLRLLDKQVYTYQSLSTRELPFGGPFSLEEARYMPADAVSIGDDIGTAPPTDGTNKDGTQLGNDQLGQSA